MLKNVKRKLIFAINRKNRRIFDLFKREQRTHSLKGRSMLLCFIFGLVVPGT